MSLSPVKLYYNYTDFEKENYIEFNEENTDYKTIMEHFDKYPWDEELAALEKYDESGGMYVAKGDTNNVYGALNLYSVELGKVSIAFDVRAKKGFLGLFGNKKVNKDIGYISHNEAKIIIRDLCELSEDQLCDKYK